jgi:hypothetical protein
MDMRKLASLSIAVLASFALAGAASATITMAVVGSNAPGTNVYSITLSVDVSDNVVGFFYGVAQDGSYNGIASVLTPFPFSSASGILSLAPCVNCTVGNFGAVTGVNGIVPTGTYTVGTISLTVGVGDVIAPTFAVPVGGITVYTGSTSSTIQPTGLTGVTIIPEPTTASLLGLGIVGLVLAGRKRRA